MSKITITWHGHSCFMISSDGYDVVLDPYKPDSVPGLASLSLTADMTLCSHDHFDHGYTDAVCLRKEGKKNPFTITVLDTFHDDAGGTLRGTNRIHILEADGLRIAHFGDLGCALNEEQTEQLKGLDAVLIPVGGYYTIDAAQAFELVQALSPRVVVPMHYRSDSFGFPVIARLEAFTSRCGNVINYDTNHIVIDKETVPQTAILSLV